MQTREITCKRSFLRVKEKKTFHQSSPHIPWHPHLRSNLFRNLPNLRYRKYELRCTTYREFNHRLKCRPFVHRGHPRASKLVARSSQTRLKHFALTGTNSQIAEHVFRWISRTVSTTAHWRRIVAASYPLLCSRTTCLTARAPCSPCAPLSVN